MAPWICDKVTSATGRDTYSPKGIGWLELWEFQFWLSGPESYKTKNICTYITGQSTGFFSSLVTWCDHGREAAFSFWLLILLCVLHLPKKKKSIRSFDQHWCRTERFIFFACNPFKQSTLASVALNLFKNTITPYLGLNKKKCTHITDGLLGLRHRYDLLVGHHARVPCLLLWELRLRLKGLFEYRRQTWSLPTIHETGHTVPFMPCIVGPC